MRLWFTHLKWKKIRSGSYSYWTFIFYYRDIQLITIKESDFDFFHELVDLIYIPHTYVKNGKSHFNGFFQLDVDLIAYHLTKFNELQQKYWQQKITDVNKTQKTSI